MSHNMSFFTTKRPQHATGDDKVSNLHMLELKQNIADNAVDQWQSRKRADLSVKGQYIQQLLN